MEKFAPLAQNFTLLPAVTAATNLTSVVTTTSHLFINSVKSVGGKKPGFGCLNSIIAHIKAFSSTHPLLLEMAPPKI